jgi:hypothetical protein
VLLLCACEAPGECHRHQLIACALHTRGLVTQHIYRDEIVESDELARAITEGTGYRWRPFTGAPP